MLILCLARALEAVTELVSRVKKLSVADSTLFLEYILPILSRFSAATATSGPQPPLLVRLTFAACLPRLADTGRRFMEMTQFMKVARYFI